MTETLSNVVGVECSGEAHIITMGSPNFVSLGWAGVFYAAQGELQAKVIMAFPASDLKFLVCILTGVTSTLFS